MIASLEDPSRKCFRSERFKDHLVTNITAASEDETDSKMSSIKRFRGFSTELEKPYLRLTSAPKSSAVRPLKILRQSLEMVKSKYLQNSDYSYACEQLKSIRQDLTVQTITNRFCAHVYETHARIALESGDLSEYNQCQSRLQEMKHTEVPISSDEFDCYRILHAALRDNKLELICSLRELSSHRKDIHDDSAVGFALKVVKALKQPNTTQFFQLYKNAPHLSGYLLDYSLNKMRKLGYAVLLKGFMTVSVSKIKEDFAFHSHKECQEFLNEQNAVIVKSVCPETQKVEYNVDCKLSIPVSTFPFPNTIFTSEPKNHPKNTIIPAEKNQKNIRTEKNKKSKNGQNGLSSQRNVIMSTSSATTSFTTSSSSSFSSSTSSVSSLGLVSKSHSNEKNGKNEKNAIRFVDLTSDVKISKKIDRGNISGIKKEGGLSGKRKDSGPDSTVDKRQKNKQRKLILS